MEAVIHMEKTQNKKIKLLINTCSVLIYLILVRACIYASLHHENMSVTKDGYVYLTFFLIPFLLAGALYGYVFAMGNFLCCFVIALIFDMNSAYGMAIYLVATLCFALFSQYFWFMDKKKTILAALYTLLMTSFVEFACFTVISTNEYTFSNIWQYGVYISRDAIGIFAIAFIIHFFYVKTPDIVKMVFPLGIGYTKAFQANQEIKRNLRKTRVSVKITAIIIGVELILSIFVAIFMVVLFPDIKNMMTTSINDAEFEAEENVEMTKDEMINHLERMDYRFNASAVGFDIKMILMMLCIGVPLAAFANYYSKMHIGMPLGMLSDFMYEFANADDDKRMEVGHKVDKLRVRSRDEIQVVHESMKTTVHSIEEYIKHIKEEQELEKELEVAQKASEAKSSFLSNMSHEIRTPINAVLGMNEMILRESEDEQILEYANNVKNAGSSLLSIINDILDFSKIEAGKMDILPVQYHIGSMINDLINMVSAKAQDKGLELEVNVDKKLPTSLIGDEVRIKQCVTNVLSNAVKYTEKGSITMNVSYSKVDDLNILLRFQVVDTGIGIKEEDLGKLFSPFERIEEIRNRSVEGTGLGMSIVKKLLAMMDTKLVVKSVYGEGSDFSFEVKQQVVSWEELGDFKQKYREYLKSLKRYHEKFRAPDAEILVVDDTAMNLMVIKGLLKKTLVHVDTAESGKETLEKVVKKKYDAIFIDHRMPEMDGIETLEAMKDLEGNLNVGIPVIALTANAGANAREEYLAAGFDDYLSKPVDGGVLEDMLKKYLPKEKVVDAEGDITEDKTSDAERVKTMEIPGINLEEAEKNCGGKEFFEDIVKEFYNNIDSKADDIERFEKEKDYRNYTVAVHALKSSARIIGAMELSKQAAYLEKCGDKEEISEIKEKTPDLLELYRSYKEKLSCVCEKNSDGKKTEIQLGELEEAFGNIKELLQAFDYDSANELVNMLDGYSIPDDYQEKYMKVKELMAAVDTQQLIEML